MLLLWSMATLAPNQTKVLHVNHQLHPNSLSWADRVQEVCTHWAIPCVIVPVTIPSGTGNLEARARAARYEVFSTHLEAQDVIWLAHHQNDQVETFLLHLMRGSGVSGLAGMPQQRPVGQGVLFRPWLEVPQAVLAELAHALGLTWVDDPANTNLAFDRNYIRHEILPRVIHRWPHALQQVTTTQHHLAEAHQDLDAYYSGLLAQLVAADGSLWIDRWVNTGSEAHQLSLLRAWLSQHVKQAPSYQQLRQVQLTVAQARPDAQGQIDVGNVSIRRYQQRLYCVQARPRPPLEMLLDEDVHSQFSVQHPSFGTLWFEPRLGEGIDLTQIHEPLMIRFRQGGEVMRPKGRRHHRDIKRLMQELSIPPWWRDQVPLI
jgi:tRNA(Ile)-lysidine synthase